MLYYQDQYCYYFWKDAGVASAFGKQESFLDFIISSSVPEIQAIVHYLQDMFGKDSELGMLNRLDNDTSGLLYFTKTPLFYQMYRILQAEGHVSKTYITDVYGEFPWNDKIINYPIGNHKYNSDRVVVISQDNKKDLIKGKIHNLETKVEKLYYDKYTNISTLSIKIKKGFRHQIRAHLTSIGYPIVGEKIYIKKKKEGKLMLFCVGMKIA